MKGALPPSYVNTPVAIAHAEANDALIVTMTRLLGLCWAYDYERTPALMPEQLTEFTGRPRSTLYHHLKLLREMQSIRVDQAGRRIVIRPIIMRNASPGCLCWLKGPSVTLDSRTDVLFGQHSYSCSITGSISTFVLPQSRPTPGVPER